MLSTADLYPTFSLAPSKGVGGATKNPNISVGVLNIIQKVLAMPLQSPNGVCMPPPIFICDLVHCKANLQQNQVINKFFLTEGILAYLQSQ